MRTYELLEIELKNLLRKRETAIHRVKENERQHLKAQEVFKKESQDVEQLEQQSLSTFVQNLLGTYEEKLDKEKQEQIEAKIELDTAASLHLDAIEELSILEEDIKSIQRRMDELREELAQTNPEFKEKMTQKEIERAELEQEVKELDEAIKAGEDVLFGIELVLKQLDSANSMATVDLFTDSLLIDLIKYNKIDKAEQELSYLEQALDRYQKELNDVDLQTALAYEELNQMSRAFDIFFDNIFSDWNTRNTIQKNIVMLEDMMHEAEDVQNLLVERERKINKKIQFTKKFL
ncbi:MAG TPA: hypothetical protein VK048_00800 [Atopostipes sp.]|nr:hypothetical protein [Atopostipes sp.]